MSEIVRAMWNADHDFIFSPRMFGAFWSEADLQHRLISALEARSAENGIHFHAGPAFTFRPHHSANGELREAIERFVPWWTAQTQRERYAFTVDIMAHTKCDNSTILEFCGEVKYHMKWRGRTSLRLVNADIAKLSQLKKAGVCKTVAFFQAADVKGRGEVEGLISEYSERDPELLIFTHWIPDIFSSEGTEEHRREKRY